MGDDFHNIPRLFIDQPFSKNAILELSKDQNHYLKNVLRRKKGDNMRVFNAKDGEFIAKIEEMGKKSGVIRLESHLFDQKHPKNRVFVLFCPIKKQKMDFLIEKAVELGATDLVPVISERTQYSKINDDRLHAQMMEAAEQCERMDIPHLHDAQKLEKRITEWDGPDIYACIESDEVERVSVLPDQHQDVAFLIGPEGGFTHGEAAWLSDKDYIHPLSLGSRILRAETAVLFCLARFTDLS